MSIKSSHHIPNKTQGKNVFQFHHNQYCYLHNTPWRTNIKSPVIYTVHVTIKHYSHCFNSLLLSSPPSSTTPTHVSSSVPSSAGSESKEGLTISGTIAFNYLFFHSRLPLLRAATYHPLPRTPMTLPRPQVM